MLEVLNDLIPNIMNKLPEFWQAILDFFIMLGITGAVSFIFGTLFGVILTVTRRGDILENKVIYFIWLPTDLGFVSGLYKEIPSPWPTVILLHLKF